MVSRHPQAGQGPSTQGDGQEEAQKDMPSGDRQPPLLGSTSLGSHALLLTAFGVPLLGNAHSYPGTKSTVTLQTPGSGGHPRTQQLSSLSP